MLSKCYIQNSMRSKIKKTWLGKIKSIKNKQPNLYYNIEDYQ